MLACTAIAALIGRVMRGMQFPRMVAAIICSLLSSWSFTFSNFPPKTELAPSVFFVKLFSIDHSWVTQDNYQAYGSVATLCFCFLAFWHFSEQARGRAT
jgi:hypothetical protein